MARTQGSKAEITGPAVRDAARRFTTPEGVLWNVDIDPWDML